MGELRSCSSLILMMEMAGSTGTDVKRALHYRRPGIPLAVAIKT